MYVVMNCVDDNYIIIVTDVSAKSLAITAGKTTYSQRDRRLKRKTSSMSAHQQFRLDVLSSVVKQQAEPTHV